ncbi:MAG: hypothetical protein ACJ79E_20705 [Anaeromyxobacteraceae bacterium]
MRATHLIPLLLAIGGRAGAQDAAKTWDFQVGLWTKADSVTNFDGLSVRRLQ